MKKLILVPALLILLHVSYAQDFCFGPKIGVNYSSLSTNLTGVSEDAELSFTGGAFARIGILGFYAQPEVLFNQRKGSYSYTVLGQSAKSTVTLSYLDVPLLAGKKFLGVARVNIGPNLQFLMDASQSGDKDPDFNRSNYNDFVVGGIAGVGVDILKLTVDLRYDFSIMSLGKKVTNSLGREIDYSSRANMWQITVGYKLFDL